MIQRNKTVDSKEYSDLTHKQKNILHAASGCDKSNTEIAREVTASLSYVAEVLNNYSHMLPLNGKPEPEGDKKKEYSDLTTTQQYILDLRSSGLESEELIADQVGCSETYVYKTTDQYQNMIPTPGYSSNESSETVAADGGEVTTDSDEAESVTVTIQCDCGKVHEISIE